MQNFIKLFLYFLPLTVGIIAVTLYAVLYLKYRVMILKYYFIILILVASDVYFQLIRDYCIVFNLKGNTLDYMADAYLFIWSAFVVYYFPAFVFSLTGGDLSKVKKALLAVFPGLLTGLGILPFLVMSNSHDMLKMMSFEVDWIVNPILFMVIFYCAAFAATQYKKIDNDIVQSLIKAFVIYVILSLVLVIFDFNHPSYFTKIFNFGDILPTYPLLFLAVLLWNFFSIIFLFLYAKKTNSRLFTSAHHIVYDLKSAGNIFGESLDKYRKSKLAKEEADSILKKLLLFMKNRKPYLDPELKLLELSKMMELTRNQLSQVINQHKGQNFYDFINAYRVEEATKLLKSPESENKNILEIALDAGFNTKSTFYLAFKKVTGMNPLEYKSSLLQITHLDNPLSLNPSRRKRQGRS